ncbi:hypothetical protein B7435_07130 [Mycolicibacterium peregrinum]|uniref:hypothetical protein n=1 Tax=Mycolicibacterium peregrinum TaxID=43304 RepID=UPI000B6CCF8B|nr:hypothetical protein [Mycolicibacterium peregrinum]OWM07850.1 hypothetical protein B7435_07130 [Mycolicibacterium peregrinum]
MSIDTSSQTRALPEREALRAQQLKELIDVRRALAEARRQERAAAVEYAATPDGAAETYRRFELASTESERAELQEIYLAGLDLASQEYIQRQERNAASARDGDLQVVPVGEFTDPVSRLLISQRVMATYRSGPAALSSGTVTVNLLILLPDSVTRRRTRLSAHADLGVITGSLADIITTAWRDAKARARISELIGAAASNDLAAAITQRATAVQS